MLRLSDTARPSVHVQLHRLVEVMVPSYDGDLMRFPRETAKSTALCLERTARTSAGDAIAVFVAERPGSATLFSTTEKNLAPANQPAYFGRVQVAR